MTGNTKTVICLYIASTLVVGALAVGFIIGVIQDSCETALNSSSDVVFTAAAELRARRRAGLSTELPIPASERTHGISLDSDPARPSIDPAFVERGPRE